MGLSQFNNNNIPTFNNYQRIEDRYREQKELNYKHIKTKLSPFHRKLRETRSVESRESGSKKVVDPRHRNDYIYPTQTFRRNSKNQRMARNTSVSSASSMEPIPQPNIPPLQIFDKETSAQINQINNDLFVSYKQIIND